MSTPKPVQVMHFTRDIAGEQSSCQIRVYEDGSAFIAGEDVAAIFEETPDAAERAVEYVKAHGYVRCEDR